MNTLMTVRATQNANKRMFSRQVAELTGKRHADVMRDIRNMVNQINQSRSALVDCSSDYHRGNRDQYKFLSESTQSAILDFAFGNKFTLFKIKCRQNPHLRLIDKERLYEQEIRTKKLHWCGIST